MIKKLIFSAVLLTSSFANAGIIYSGTIINDSGFHGSYASSHVNDQSGLSDTYVSGTTDYDTYASLNPTHTGSSSTSGISGTGALDLGVQAAFIDFDFGMELMFTDFGLWNDVDTQGIKNFNVLVSNDVNFSTFTTLGLFTATIGFADPIPLQQFDLLDTTGRYVRVDMLSTHGSTNINFGEFIFGASSANAVPEPSTLAIFALGIMGFASRRFKKQSK
jgi:hypothetical protein